MRLDFKSVHIEGFLSLGVVDIDLANSGYTLVSGVNMNDQDNAESNGSGKSSIFEAVVWCLTGSTMRGSKDVCNTHLTSGTLVELDVDIDGVAYKICRSKDHAVYKTNLKLFKDGADVSGKGIRDSEKLLAEYVPDLTPELLGSVIVLGQGLPARFTRNTPSGRKDTLEKLSKSDFMIEDLKDRVASRKANLAQQLRGVQDSRLVNQTKRLAVQTQLEESMKKLSALEEQQDLDIEVRKLSSTLSTYQDELKELCDQHSKASSVAQSALESLNSCRALKDAQVNAVVGKAKEATSDLKIARATLQANKEALARRLRELQSITGICPTCGQPLKDVEIPSTAAEELELENITQKISNIDCQIKEVEDTCSADTQSIQAAFCAEDAMWNSQYREAAEEANRIQQHIAETERLIRTTDNALREKELLLRTHDTQVAEQKKRQQDAAAELQMLTDADLELSSSESSIQEHQAVVAKFETTLKRDFRGELLNNVIAYIQDAALVYSEDIFDHPAVEFKLDGNNIVIRYDGRDYENLSGGERQKVDLVVQFALREMLCTFLNFNSSILVLDEIFDNLDSRGSQKVNDMLAKRLATIDSIFIVSHHTAELNIPVDKTLTVVKDSTGVSSLR